DRPRAHPRPKNFPHKPMRAHVISGISPRFRGLSQSPGQVTHVLLTRSPLEYPQKGLSARLACVKHAASVRPEPGSNSPTKTCGSQKPRQQTSMLPKNQPDKNLTRQKHSWHWLIKHPVEFSKNNHTPRSTSPSRLALGVPPGRPLRRRPPPSLARFPGGSLNTTCRLPGRQI